MCIQISLCAKKMMPNVLPYQYDELPIDVTISIDENQSKRNPP